jgi:hypothetical protein
VLKSLGLAVVLAAVSLVIVASGASADKKGPDLNWQEKVPKFTQALEASGFSLHEAEFAYFDFVDMNCQGKMYTTLANNPWPNAYMVMTDTQRLEDPTPPYDEFWDKFPWFWQLREDEAFVLVGQTPPAARYFSFQTTALMVPGDEWTPTRWKPVGINVGDNTNNLTIRTIGPGPFEAPIVYIITGNRETERRVRAAARAAGYPDAIINVETVSSRIVPLGIGPQGSVFVTAARAAVADDKGALNDYIINANLYMKAFRLTPVDDPSRPPGPEPVLPVDPEPVPILRVKGTGHTEMELWPAVQRLRRAILERYAMPGSPAYDFKELDTKIWTMEIPFPEDVPGPQSSSITVNAEKPYATLQRGAFMGGGTRDNNYLATYPNFKLLPEDDAFVIVYGVNHQTTNKASYGSFSLYLDAIRWVGIDTKTSPNFDDPDGDGPLPAGQPGDSARYYLGDDPDAQYLYAWKVARHCNGEPFCMETAVENTWFERPAGPPYQCPLWLTADDDLFFIFRNYMEPATAVAPDDNELVYDRAIYFGPYDFPPECPTGCTPEE